MAISKIILNGVTQMDLTGDTVAAGNLVSPNTAHGADGQAVAGSVQSVQQATPSISVSSGGLITASATQSAGVVAAGTQQATQQLTTRAGATILPTTTRQTAVAANRYTTGTVYIAGDQNLIPENIKAGVDIFNVVGEYEGGGGSGIIENSALVNLDPWESHIAAWPWGLSVDMVRAVAVYIPEYGLMGPSSVSYSGSTITLDFIAGWSSIGTLILSPSNIDGSSLDSENYVEVILFYDGDGSGDDGGDEQPEGD